MVCMKNVDLPAMIAKAFWILTFFGAAFGGAFVLSTFVQDSAPKQAASAALGCGLAIVPYVLARAASELSAPAAKQEDTQPAGRRLGMIAGVTVCVLILLTLLAEIAGQIAKFVG